MNIDMDTADCTIYDNCTNEIVRTTFYHFNPVFTFFLIFSAATFFYHCTTKTDLSLFEEFLRIIHDENFHNILVSSGTAIRTMFIKGNNASEAITNDQVVSDPIASEAIDTKDIAIKFEDKFLDQFLALKSQSELTPEFLENLANNFVMEHTPNGNIIMFYDHKRETFSYYADNVMPFRFLEVLGRKYVCTFQCPSLYHYSAPAPTPAPASTPSNDTVELLVKEELNTTTNATNSIVFPEGNEKKKQVFANFKSYNKDTSKQTVTKDASPNVPKRAVTTNTTTPVIEPTNTVRNRYTCHGKICNMPFLKKIDRTIVDKNYKMSFSDFKRLKTNQ